MKESPEGDKERTDILAAYKAIVREILFTPEILPKELADTPNKELLESAKQQTLDSQSHRGYVTRADLDAVEAKVKEEFIQDEIEKSRRWLKAVGLKD